VRHECLTNFILSIPEGIVEHQTSVHHIHALTSILCHCVGWFYRCVEGKENDEDLWRLIIVYTQLSQILMDG
jgi:hypothetical protein